MRNSKGKTRNLHKTKKTKKIYKIYKKGGKAIDAGSYGCVFDPALKCSDKNISYNPEFVSKLMYVKDAQVEFNELNNVRQYVEKIKDNDKYFILSNTTICNPDKLQGDDLVSFDDKCRLFTKRNLNSSNINENLSKLKLINLPNGGLNIEKIWENMLNDVNINNSFIKINNALISLLVNGIVPLNKLGFNHYDVKAGNILIASDGNARLIDWGLAGANNGSTIPETITDRSIAFNMPFSDIFFNKFIKKWLPTEMARIKASPSLFDKNAGQKELLKVVAVNLINNSLNLTSEGHYDYVINSILHDMYKIYASSSGYNLLDYNVLSYNVLIEYIQAVLLAFVDENGNFNDINYFYQVFTHNADIWGLLISYAFTIEEGTNRLHSDIINGICRILIKYCFSPEFATKPIVVNDLAAELQSLNNIALNQSAKSKFNKYISNNNKKNKSIYI